MKYFRRPWEECRGDRFDNWGWSVWYFELADDGYPNRQIEVYASGPVLKYDADHLRDEYGGLGDQSLDVDEDGMAPFEIGARAFEDAWIAFGRTVESYRDARQAEGRWAVTNSMYAMDGGSIYLALRDPSGAPHSLHLPQHALPTTFAPDEPPGALIFDGKVLSVRGPDEAALLEALRTARFEALRPLSEAESRIGRPGERILVGEDVREFVEAVDRGPNEAMRHLVERIVGFFESEEYLEVARRQRRVP